MSTLYIRLPSRVAAESALHWPATGIVMPCPFALVSHGNAITRQGELPLSELSGTIAGAQRVVLLLAASDVSLLRVQVPPLSAARLKAALPNLVEDHLLADPADCVVVAGGLSEGLRTVAVAQRDWLSLLTKTLIAYGARHLSALPAQLCLAYSADSVSAAIDERDNHIDITMRISEQEGIGFSIQAENNAAAAQVIQALRSVIPEKTIALYVPQASVHAYQEAASTMNINIAADNWTRWITGAQSTLPDLMAGQSAGVGSKPDWRPWRWPLALAAIILLINAAALNLDWWRMKNESATLRATLTQIYKSAYPKETVIIDPVAQIQQKISLAKHNSGMASPDDFTALATAFGEAWASVSHSAAPPIATLEYRERTLFVGLKPVLSQAEGAGIEVLAQQIKSALAENGLSLEQGSAEPSSAVVWQIRSAK